MSSFETEFRSKGFLEIELLAKNCHGWDPYDKAMNILVGHYQPLINNIFFEKFRCSVLENRQKQQNGKIDGLTLPKLYRLTSFLIGVKNHELNAWLKNCRLVWPVCDQWLVCDQ